MKRREFLRRVPFFAVTTLAACGGGGQDGGGEAATASPAAPSLSTPTTAFAGVASDNWGLGSAAGTFVADVWTPGHDDSGIVNLVSWDLVPINRWVEVADTRLDALNSIVLATMPGFRDYGAEGWSGVTNDWAGFAVDKSRVWLLGGGHAGSSNNGLYCFDGLRMRWAVEHMPSDPTPWSTSYKQSGSFTPCGESGAQYSAKLSAGTLSPINDWFWDELFWDRQPTARHTYSSMVYAPATNELIMICRRLWVYSLDSHQWVYKRIIADQLDGKYMDGENIVATWDEKSSEVLASSAGSSGIYRAVGFKRSTNTWTGFGSPWNIYADVADARHGRNWTVMHPPKSAGGGYGGSDALYWRLNLDTRQVEVRGTATYAGGISQSSFVDTGSFYDSASMCYIPELDRYWLLTKMADGTTKIVQINPTTTPWRVGPILAYPAAAPSTIPNPERKMVYLESLKAVMLCATADRNISLYRLA